MKPSNKQCEIARAMTKSNISDEQISRELLVLTQDEWNKECETLDKLLKEHNMAFDKGWNIMVRDFSGIGSRNQVNEATMFIAYMNWKSK